MLSGGQGLDQSVVAVTTDDDVAGQRRADGAAVSGARCVSGGAHAPRCRRSPRLLHGVKNTPGGTRARLEIYPRG